MPKRRRDSDEEESAVESGADSEESLPKKKKPKKANQKAPKAANSSKSSKKEDVETTEREVNDVRFNVTGGESWVELGTNKKKRLTIRSFKGTTYVDIREFYEDRDTGERKPGKKGISLTVDEWHEIVSIAEGVSTVVAGNE